MSNRDEIKQYLIAVFGEPTTHDHEKQIEAHVECAEMWGDYYAKRENARLCLLLADIRSALGDPEGKMMQEDFVQHCKEVVEWLNKLDFADWKGGAIKNRGEYGFALYDLGGCIVEHYKTPLEALTAYLKGKE